MQNSQRESGELKIAILQYCRALKGALWGMRELHDGRCAIIALDRSMPFDPKVHAPEQRYTSIPLIHASAASWPELAAQLGIAPS